MSQRELKEEPDTVSNRSGPSLSGTGAAEVPAERVAIDGQGDRDQGIWCNALRLLHPTARFDVDVDVGVAVDVDLFSIEAAANSRSQAGDKSDACLR